MNQTQIAESESREWEKNADKEIDPCIRNEKIVACFKEPLENEINLVPIQELHTFNFVLKKRGILNVTHMRTTNRVLTLVLVMLTSQLARNGWTIAIEREIAILTVNQVCIKINVFIIDGANARYIPKRTLALMLKAMFKQIMR